MARHVEEEENYWPGFVDALSTIVMVVTFLLIILGVAIFAISTQVSKALSEASQAATEKTPQAAAVEKLQSQVSALQKQRQQAQAQAAEESAALQLTAAAEAKAQADAAAAKAQLTALSSEKTAADAQAQALAAQLAKAQAAKAAPSPAAAAPQPTSQADAAAPALAAQLAAAETAATAAAQAADAKAAELAAAQATVAQQRQQLASMTAKIATLNQAGSPAPTQDETVKADNNLKISSRVVPNPTEITVAAPQDATAEKPVQVVSASQVLTVRFQAGAVQMGDAAHAQAVDFVNNSGAVIASHKIALWSFYDAGALGLTQVKRSAYFRALALRNALLDAKVDSTKIDISVRAADTPADVDTVKAFLQD